MAQSIKAYVRSQEIGPVLGNIIINPLLAWLGNRKMESVTLFGDHGIILDTAFTALIASLLVTLFAVSGVRRDLKAGRITVPEQVLRPASPLFHLPRNPWLLGLAMGAAMAAVLLPLITTGFYLFDLEEIPFGGFLAIKALYTGLLGLLVARCAVFRTLAENGSLRVGRRERSGSH